MRRHADRAAALLGAALLAACAPHGTTLVVVVPGEAGHVGGVVVDAGGAQTVLDQPYAATWAAADGKLTAQQLSADEVARTFAAAREAQPMRPVSFTLYFREGTDQFTTASRRVVDEIFAEIARRPVVEIAVIGHTDREGLKRDNDRLSRQRAERVRQDLIQRGIAAQAIKASGRGEREPVVPSRDETEEPRNRRVEINVR